MNDAILRRNDEWASFCMSIILFDIWDELCYSSEVCFISSIIMFHTQYTDTRYQSLKLEVMSIFSFGWYLTKKNIVPLLIISFIVNFPWDVLGDYLINNEIFSVSDGVRGLKELDTLYKMTGLLLYPIGIAAVSYIIRDFLIGTPYVVDNLKKAFVFSCKKWWYILGVLLLTTLAVIGGTIAFIIPWMIISLWLTFGVYGVSFEELKPIESLKYSKSLVYGRWWTVFGLVFLIGILSFFCFKMPVSILVFCLELLWPGWTINDMIVNFLGVIVYVPLVMVSISTFLALQKFPVQPSVSTIENSASSAT